MEKSKSYQFKVANICLHHGEEPPISGTSGSGTFFFTGCNLKCVFCQNYQISQEGLGSSISIDDLAEKMVELQKQGTHNINLVSPTHYGSRIVDLIKSAREKGLNIPIVYNSNGYDSLAILKQLKGLVQIYMPDIKYGDDSFALKYSSAKGYVGINQAAIKEMFNQVGNLHLDEDGIAIKGILVRHLVLPNNLSQSKDCLDFLSSISKDLYVSIMSQYHPCYKAGEHPELNRLLSPEEYYAVVDYAEELGMENLFIQELSSHKTYLPQIQLCLICQTYSSCILQPLADHRY
ncbi:MAG: radical SAM protein [Candidatus Saganbacteria bacterium]|nr:radical SAM protein [Candidatus Saganbacteria bacterium]